MVRELADGIFGNEASMMFFYYWADSKDLTEHGSGLSGGGWLTELGKEVLEDLNEILGE